MLNKLLDKWRSNEFVRRFLSILSLDVLVKASGILLLPVYLKLMTREEYGLYGFLINIISSFALFLNLGLYVAEIKLYSNYSKEERGAFLFTINLFLLICLVILFLAAYISDADFVIVQFLVTNLDDYAEYRIYILLLVAYSIFNLMLQGYFLTSEKIKHIQSYNLCKLLAVNSCVLLALYFLNQNAVVIRLKYSLIAESVILACFGIFLLKQMKVSFQTRFIIRALKIGLPIMAASVLNLVYGLTDRFVLEKFYGLDTLAIYNLGLAVSSVISLATASFYKVYAPLFFKETNPMANLRSARKMMKAGGVVLLVAAVGMICGTWLMLELNFIDMGYFDVLYLLPFLIAAAGAQAANIIYANFMPYFEITIIVFINNAVSNLVNLGLNFALVPSYGIYGAGLATLISSLIVFGMSYYFAKRQVYKAVQKAAD